MNTAQRIVGFAEPGQITISRSFFELVSRLAPEYSGIFVHIGTHDDKHGREHDLYLVKPAQDMLGKLRDRLQLTVAEATGVSVVFSDPARTVDKAQTSGVVSPRMTSRMPLAAPASQQPIAPPPASNVRSMPAATPRFGLRPIIIVAVAVMLAAAIIMTPLLTRKTSHGPSPDAAAASPPAAPALAPASAPGDRATARSAAGASVDAAAPVTPPPGPPAVNDQAATSTPTAAGATTPADDAHSTTPTNKVGTTSAAAKPAASSPVDATPTSPDTASNAAPSAANGATQAPVKHATRPSASAKRAAATDEQVQQDAAAATPGGANAATRGTYTRCSSLMQKATLGEPLTANERHEMELSCR